MNPPTDFSQVLALLLAQLAPYIVSGPLLSHVIEQWQIVKAPETPNFVKIGIAFGVALAAIFANSLVTGAYAGGANFSVYLQATLQQAGLLFGTMTITNVSASSFVPSLADWVSNLFGNVVAAITKVIHPNAGAAG